MINAAAVALLAVVLAAVVVVVSTRDPSPPPTVAAAEAAHQLAQVERAEAASQAEAAADAAWVGPRAAARNLAALAVYTLPVLALAAGVVYAWSRRGLVWARKGDGTLPVPRHSLTVDLGAATIAARHASEHALASVQTPALTSLTYSPRSEWRQDVDVAAGEPAALPPATGSSLLGADPLNVFLGTGAQGPHVRPWDDLLTVGFTGDTGQGKTWSCVSLVYQAIDAGHRVVVLDPQGGNADGLAARLAPVAHLVDRIAVEDHEIAAAVASVRRTFAERSKRADGGVISKADLQPVTVAVDEVLVLGRELPHVPLAGMLQDLAQGGRKCAMRALALAQRWATASDAIDADFRNTITQWVIHQSPPQDASMATAKRRTTDELRKAGVGSLQPGECLLSLRGSELVRVVQPTPDDLLTFANRFRTASGPLPGGARELPPVASGKRSGSGPEAVAEVVGGAADPLYEEARRLFREGCTAQEVRDVIAGRRVTKGREFDAANARLNAILQALAMESGP